VIKNPLVLALVVGTLHYFGTKYPELRQAVDSILIALGVGGGAAFIRGMNGKGVINGQNGGSPSHTGSNSLPPSR
jgi:hypothetical protein